MVEVQAEMVFHEAGRLGLPRVIFINKMDRDRADAEACLKEIEETLGVRPVALQVPIGSETDFKGVVSLFQRKALIYKTDGSGQYEDGHSTRFSNGEAAHEARRRPSLKPMKICWSCTWRHSS